MPCRRVFGWRTYAILVALGRSSNVAPNTTERSMKDRRTLLLKLLADAEDALAVRASSAAEMPDGTARERDALEDLAATQLRVRRITKLLNKLSGRS